MSTENDEFLDLLIEGITSTRYETPSGVFETIYCPPTSDIGDWAYKNWELLEKKYGVKGSWNSKFSRGDYYTITHIPGHPFRGVVGTDHVGRNLDDEDVMVVQRFLEQVRAMEQIEKRFQT